MAIKKVDIAALSVDELLSAEVESVLRKESVFTPTVRMKMAKIGLSSFDYVLGDDITIVNVLEDGSEPESTGLIPTVVNIVIDKYKKAARFITDQAMKQSDVDMEGQFLENAPQALAAEIESDNVAGALAAVVGGNELTYGAIVNDLITLDDVINQDEIMNTAKIPKAGRFWMVSPKCYANLLKIDNILDASKRGDDTSAIVNGFVSKTMGFTFIMSNDLLLQDSLVYHESFFVYVSQEAANYEKERQASKNRDYHGIKSLYGQDAVHVDRVWHYTEQLV
tara:strand:- start:634 stop:1473 length:840 start_codon:yes stop_codon:yes gene_type:complete